MQEQRCYTEANASLRPIRGNWEESSGAIMRWIWNRNRRLTGVNEDLARAATGGRVGGQGRVERGKGGGGGAPAAAATCRRVFASLWTAALRSSEFIDDARLLTPGCVLSCGNCSLPLALSFLPFFRPSSPSSSSSFSTSSSYTSSTSL